MIKFAPHFGLSLEQPELDFVNIPLDGDLPVYLDPYAFLSTMIPLVANAMMLLWRSFRLR
jgi:hypothetical protein